MPRRIKGSRYEPGFYLDPDARPNAYLASQALARAGGVPCPPNRFGPPNHYVRDRANQDAYTTALYITQPCTAGISLNHPLAALRNPLDASAHQGYCCVQRGFQTGGLSNSAATPNRCLGRDDIGV